MDAALQGLEKSVGMQFEVGNADDSAGEYHGFFAALPLVADATGLGVAVVPQGGKKKLKGCNLRQQLRDIVKDDNLLGMLGQDLKESQGR